MTNVEVLEPAEVPSIEAMLLKYKLRWAGHVTIQNGGPPPA